MQIEDWINISNEVTTDDIERNLRNPVLFQKEFASLLCKMATEICAESAAEIGCETGVTLMLVENVKNKVFLDFDGGVLEKVKMVCARNSITGSFICADMFKMTPILSGSVDLVFNSGVIEHYSRPDRSAALKEYVRIARKDGLVVIAYPNHFSFLYRAAYIVGRLAGKRYWPWPAEFKIRNLRQEMESAGLNYEGCLLIDNITTSLFYRRIPLIGWIARRVATSVKSERYLRICVGRKI